MNCSALPSVDQLISTLALSPHPEGGYYRETYRASRRDGSGRAASTLIYFLLPQGHVSRLHRIDADESWHFYAGGPLDIFELDEHAPEDPPRISRLGNDFASGERPQHVVPAGRWFGAAPAAGTPFALVGCTVAPAFEFAGFELADRARLLALFPQATEVIRRLT